MRFPSTGIRLKFTGQSGVHTETNLRVLGWPEVNMSREEGNGLSEFILARGTQKTVVDFALAHYEEALLQWKSPSYRDFHRNIGSIDEHVSRALALSVFKNWLVRREGSRGLISFGGYFPERVAFTPFTARPTTLSLVNQIMFDFFRAPADDFHHSMERIRYIGPFRRQPSRVFSRPMVAPTEVGSSGENTAAILSGNAAVLQRTNRWLKALNIPYRLKPEAFETPSKLAMPVIGGMGALLLMDQRLNVAVSIRDVGFGVSQIVPIITQLALDERQIVCIEQPEIHLHPRLQAGLADILIESSGVNTTAGRSTQVIAETHSEALMLRLQRRVREGACDPERVSVLYVDHVRGKGSVVRQLRLDERGNFVDVWPHGFFEDSFEDLIAGF